MRTLCLICLLLPLSGCFCTPDPGEGIGTDYFKSCWSAAKNGHSEGQ